MDSSQQQQHSPIVVLVMIFIALAVVTLVPTLSPNWGSFVQKQPETVMVTGSAESRFVNEVASFSVTVSVTDSSKDSAVSSVNTEMTKIIERAKEFGIPEVDIQTQSVNVYEIMKPEYPYPVDQDSTVSSGSQGNAEVMEINPVAPGSPDAAPGAEPARRGDDSKEWQASNSIEIIVRDSSKVSELGDLLTSFPLAQVYGPQFRLDDSSQASNELIQEAMEDARMKAETIAAAGGRKIGKVIRVEEGYDSYNPYPMYRAEAMSADFKSMPIEPGSTEISKSLTVTFEFK